MSTTGRARQRDVVVAPSIQSALRTVATERAGLFALERALAGPLGKAFAESVARIAQAKEAKGRVVITGMGKSGHVGKKVAATFASTGTPAFFVHPGEASHGDLGMITADDVVIALSWSGETRELGDIISFASRFGVTLIAFTAAADSTLGRAADIALVLPRTEEACPHGLAPTTSSLKPRRSISATASASPSPIIIVVDVVGASPIGQASGSRGRTSARSAVRASVLSALPVMAISGMAKRRV